MESSNAKKHEFQADNRPNQRQIQNSDPANGLAES